MPQLDFSIVYKLTYSTYLLFTIFHFLLILMFLPLIFSYFLWKMWFLWHLKIIYLKKLVEKFDTKFSFKKKK